MHIAPEIALLKLAAHSRLTEQHRAEMRALLEGPLDMALLGGLARYHRVPALLRNALAQVGADQSEAMAGLSGGVRQAVLWSFFLTNELAQLMAAMEAGGVPLLAFKGPVLAHLAYARPELRTFTDLDLLVAPRQLQTFSLIAEANGYRYVEVYGPAGEARERAYLWLNQQCVYMKGRQFALDVHLNPVLPLYRYPFTQQELLGRSRQLVMNGRSVRHLSREDMLVLLCYHGIKDRWNYLRHVCDIAELATADPAPDWEQVARLAAKARSRRIVGLGLLLAHELLGTEPPEELMQPIRAHRSTRELAGNIIQRFNSTDGLGIPDFQNRLHLHLATQSSLRGKLRYGVVSALRNLFDAVAGSPEANAKERAAAKAE